MDEDGKIRCYTFAAHYDPRNFKPESLETQIIIPAHSKAEAEERLFLLVVRGGTTALWQYLFAYDYYP